MGGRTKRGFFDRSKALETLSVARTGCIEVRRKARINSPEYQAAGDIIEAIDRLAELLTGDPEYFWIKLATADQQPKK